MHKQIEKKQKNVKKEQKDLKKLKTMDIKQDRKMKSCGMR